MRARNEVEAMALKAARGAGAPLGHAEDFARAAGAMAMADAAALDSLSNALDGPFEVDASGIPLRLVGPCMMVMPLAIDALRSGEAEVLLPGAHPPALVQAYIRVAAQDFDIALEISGEKLRLGAVQPPAALPAKAVAVPGTSAAAVEDSVDAGAEAMDRRWAADTSGVKLKKTVSSVESWAWNHPRMDRMVLTLPIGRLPASKASVPQVRDWRSALERSSKSSMVVTPAAAMA